MKETQSKLPGTWGEQLPGFLPVTHSWIPFDYCSSQTLWCLSPTWTNWGWMIAETGSTFCPCLSQIPPSACWMGLPPNVCGWVYLLRICQRHPHIALLLNGPGLVLSQHTTWEVLRVVLVKAFSGTYRTCRTRVIYCRPVSPHSRTYSVKWHKVDVWHKPESRLKNLKVQVESVLIDIIWWCWLTKRALRRNIWKWISLISRKVHNCQRVGILITVYLEHSYSVSRLRRKLNCIQEVVWQAQIQSPAPGDDQVRGRFSGIMFWKPDLHIRNKPVSLSLILYPKEF